MVPGDQCIIVLRAPRMSRLESIHKPVTHAALWNTSAPNSRGRGTCVEEIQCYLFHVYVASVILEEIFFA